MNKYQSAAVFFALLMTVFVALCGAVIGYSGVLNMPTQLEIDATKDQRGAFEMLERYGRVR